MLPVTAVESAKTTSVADKTLYEFPIFGAVYLVDPSEWPPIALQRFGTPVKLLKPRVGQTNVQVEGRITRQAIDVRYTTFTFETDLYPIEQTPLPKDYLPALEGMIHLLRTVARQYWLGLTMANEGAVYQAVRARVESGTVTFDGAGGFSTPFIIRPLDWNAWRFLGDMLEKGYSPSNAEVIISDALLEIRRGSLLNAVMLLGIACEIEVTTLIDQLVSRKSLSNNKRPSIFRETFKTKFLTRTVDLGTSNPRSAKILHFATNWADTVCELYTARNKAAHSGICMIEDDGVLKPLEMRHLPKLVYAADALLWWANLERHRLGIPPFLTTAMLPGGYPVMGTFVPQ
ncbi:MAG TPA: hypothetical protein VHU83_06290 [Bryobacteraceae bacterium]|jgi:hypothetical protein|nr:hypothetical protein [Bryobacteraceae bacterium]